MKIHRDLLTEEDNTTWDPVRIGAAIGFLLMNSLGVYAVVALGQEFDIQEFGIANSTYLAGTGIALWASSNQKDAPK